ncbi:oxidase [Fusarium agapanthi]|uniref:Oxidase n=1 Tax=Fusarium agapanthi TaxID=1803897 RepID=A0A9P5AWZ6_9HYPO|nr:oxidase [Fusarium agapanthi]
MQWHYFLSLLLCVGVYGFPSYLEGPVAKVVSARLSGKVNDAVRSHDKRLALGLASKPIKVTGEHKFIPPNFEKGDQRGPCPGLNALANHGYISRKGVTSLVEVAGAINQVYGMGVDLATILATMGTVFVVNPLSLSPGFSIGNTASGSQNILGNLYGLLGTPRGLNGSHNIIDGDSSNTRDDLYVTGDASTMDMKLFQSLYDSASKDCTYGFDALAKRAKLRFHETVATNPNFYYGPFTGMIARNAGYFFAYLGTLKSFFAVQEKDGKLVYKSGWERIPENWYRRSVDYGLISLNLDLLNLITKYPELGSIRGNMGEVNSYAGVDVSNITGGVLNLTKLLEDNNLLCFVFEIFKTVALNSLSTLFSIIATPLELVTDALGSAVLKLAYPAFKDLTVGGQDFEDGIKDKFTGASLGSSVI